MKPCIIESPYAGDVARNKAYLQRCIKWSAMEQGMTPYASHQMLTDALDDTDPEQREFGLQLGSHMTNILLAAGAEVLFFVDLGWSPGMHRMQDYLDQRRVPYRVVRIDGPNL
jgi:hypothetical protein